MASLDARLMALERPQRNQKAPTPEQAAQIDRCTRTGRRLIVFCMPGDTAWMPGSGLPPWEAGHGNA